MGPPFAGMSLNAIAAKHSDKRLKFWGHSDSISEGLATLLTAASCLEEKDDVMWAIISVGEGTAVPLVSSAHIRELEPSN
jgi:hypothetical protein